MIFWKNFRKLECLAKQNKIQHASFLAKELLSASAGQELMQGRRTLIEKLCESYSISLTGAKKNDVIGGTVDEFIAYRLPGVSLVTCCMNRNENMVKALPSWVNNKNISEILIVDWSSNEPVQDYIRARGFVDPKIKVVRIDDQPRWILSYAFNLGFRLSAHDAILKTDADIIIHEDFFDKNILQGSEFISGDWRIAEKGQEHINGFFFLTYENLMKVKGFNEYITTYGWDDDDIYSRLADAGVTRRHVDVSTIYHIPHDNASRISGLKETTLNAREQLHNDPHLKIRANRFISQVMPLWNPDRYFLPCKIIGTTEGYLQVKKTGESIHQVPKHICDDAEFYAFMELVSWKFGMQAFELDKSRLYALLSNKTLETLTTLDLLIAANNPSYTGSDKPIWVLRFPGNIQNNPELKLVLMQLNKKCEALTVNSVILADLPEQLTSQVRDYKHVFCIASWSNIGNISKVSFEQALSNLKNGVTPSTFLTEIDKLEVHSFYQYIEFSAINTPKSIPVIKKDNLYIDAQHGLGNRLRAIASAASIAEKSDRNLVIVWEPDHHCECHLSDIIDYDGEVVEKSFLADIDHKVDVFNYMEVEGGANKDAEISLVTGRSVYARSAYTLNSPLTNWDDENEFLQKLKPSKDVLSLVKPFNLSQHIGAHIRMEAGAGLDYNTYDSVENWTQEGHDQLHFWREKSHFSHFIKRIDELLKQNQDAKLFLATDMSETYRFFEEYYGERTQYLQRDIYDRSKEQIVYALADAVLLSACERLLGSTWSSFSELAIRLSTTYSSMEMSGKDF